MRAKKQEVTQSRKLLKAGSYSKQEVTQSRKSLPKGIYSVFFESLKEVVDRKRG